jgi:dimethylargininase
MARGIAITRAVSSALGDCELTHLARVPIDVAIARAQHREYEQALREGGYMVEQLPSTGEMPDSVFVEDIAVVFDELAIVTRPGAESRRLETRAVADALARHRELHVIQAPGTVDGGDVLVAGKHVFVGLSSRTNEAAAMQMARLLQPHGYTIREVAVRGCLHLKSAATALSDDLMLVNPAWIDPAVFAAFYARRDRSRRAGRGKRLGTRRSGGLSGIISADRRAARAPRSAPAARRRERSGEGRGRGHVLQLDRQAGLKACATSTAIDIVVAQPFRAARSNE